MNDIQKTIKSFLEKFEIDKQDLVYLVAFSGGFDSMCLLDCLKKLTTNKIVAIHLNHNWRGEESKNEELNCKNFCSSIGVEFYSETLDENVPHTETAARDARYLFFERCAKHFNSTVVFTAHNKNDNAETLIYRIAKGTGISGLQGIAENRGIYYRPLLNICRKDIEKYCQKYNLTPNSDSSNTNTKYKRNFIRSKILPELQTINDNIINSINNLSSIAKEETEIVEEYLTYTLEKITENDKIKTKKFINLSSAMQKRIIYNMFIEQNLDYDREKILNIKNFIIENSTSKSGTKCSLTKDLWIFVNQKFIEIISNKASNDIYFHITKEGIYENNGFIFEIEKHSNNINNFPKDTENTAYVNLVEPLNYEIRTRKDGDIFYPLGLDGKQKLKKFLNGKKIPNHEKNNLLFLVQGNEILWAIGLGISEKIKVIDKPTHKLKFYKKEDK
ncbi:tRNA lysidine(34) synthetase TilS [bacterium]|nr:tRNA lysidine(34) synthetase TilS [bacterium]